MQAHLPNPHFHIVAIAKNWGLKPAVLGKMDPLAHRAQNEVWTCYQCTFFFPCPRMSISNLEYLRALTAAHFVI